MSEVQIRSPFPPEFAAKLWVWLNKPRKPNFDDYGPASPAEFGHDLAHRITRERTWGIWLDDEIAGYLGFVSHNPILGQFRGLVIAPRFRGQGVGSKALKQTVDQLHSEGFRKLMVQTFSDNQQIRQMFHKLGFHQEGYLSAATRREGKPLDIRIMCSPGEFGYEEVV